MAKLHRKFAELLRERAEANVPPMHALSVSSAREQHQALRSIDGGEDVADTTDLSIRGPETDIPLRVYRPAGSGPFPVLLWLHGGGFVLGDLDTSDPICRAIANRVGCLVVSVDYRRPPEHPFPAAPNDSYEALEWTEANIEAFDGDRDRIAVGGDSAGGNLAAVTALRARDHDGPELIHQLLIYPVTADDYSLPSRHENARGYGLSVDDMRWFDGHYVQNPVDAANPYAYPLKARSLADLPPATVLTAGFDPLRDDGARYADQLEAADVSTTYLNYDRAIHGFLGLIVEPDVEPAMAALADISSCLSAALGNRPD